MERVTEDHLAQGVRTDILSDEELRKIDAYWRAANYLSVGQIYLCDNPLLTEPLKLEHIKAAAARPLGHHAGAQFHLRPPEPADHRSTTST